MKTFSYYMIVMAVLLLHSCKQEELPTFSGEPNIYFRYTDAELNADRIDSLEVHFGYDAKIKQDSICRIPVRVMGKYVNYDRPISFQLLDTDKKCTATNADVELLSDLSLIPAGTNDGVVAVKLKNTANLNGKRLRAVFKLLENKHFKTNLHTVVGKDYFDAVVYKVAFDNDASAPNLWAYGMTDTAFKNNFGDYTDVKFRLICELCGLNRDYFTYTGEPANIKKIFSERFPSGYQITICRVVNRFLADYKRKNDGQDYPIGGDPVRLGKNGANYN